MRWWNDFAEAMSHDAPLGRLTRFRLGGRARYMFRPRSAEQLSAMVVRAKHEGISVKVLGAGANVLVTDDGFDGVVVRLDQPAFMEVDRDGVTATVGAGVELMPFALKCCTMGYAGLEAMAGIPSSIGGAVKMNAGGRHGEFGQVVREISVLRSDGAVEDWPRERVGFGYRNSCVDTEIVLSVRVDLGEDDPTKLKSRFYEHFAAKNKSQPLKGDSAGCIFKNPEGKSAGALIDQAGLKGTRRGQAVVSTRHANFILAEEGATASDVLELIEVVREGVLQTFNTALELEVEIW
ncbi:MAG: UDP-N-acetylmuramate dehydrogenase [Phycisphaerales bacterium]|nr:MAG: UDP-N-acetylmuramate dehydrogenase [Phycisphaerales bacterium]